MQPGGRLSLPRSRVNKLGAEISPVGLWGKVVQLACAAVAVGCGGGPRDGAANSAAPTATDAGPRPPLPDAVEKVRADSTTLGVVIFWEPPPNSGSPITDYAVTDESTRRTVMSAGALAVGFDNLTGGSTHCFRVYAI